MIDLEKDKEIILYVTNNTNKIIPARANKKVLLKLNYLNYITNRYSDSESLSESLYRLVFNIEDRPKCKICGGKVKYSSGKFSNYCSPKCRNNDPYVIEKNKKGVSMSLKECYKTNKQSILEKRSNTLKQHYNINKDGIVSTFEIKEIQNKAKDSLISNYGVDNIFKIKKYGKETSRKKSVELQKARGLNIEYIDDKHLKVINGCKKHGDIIIEIGMFNNRVKLDRIETCELCPICNPKYSYTSLENKIINYLDSKHIEYKSHIRNLIKPYEIDIFIPDKNIAIECNGLFWHSELFKEKNYHYNKFLMCKEKGIRLIQIWEDDLNNKSDIIFSMLNSILGITENKIYARQCNIIIPTNKQYKEFLNDNHIQGFVPSKYKYALEYNNEIVSVIGFGNLRKCLGTKSNTNEYELYRYASLKNYSVVGGFSKLLKYFINNIKPKQIISYAKSDYSVGNVYLKNGFELEKICGPNYYWKIKSKRENRFKYQKSKLDKLSNKSESEQMHELGYVKCYDSGNLKFKLNIKK